MGGIFDFGGDATAGSRPVGADLFDEIDIGEAALAELPDDPESVLVDPHIPAAVDGVVERVQAGERTPHLR